MRAARDADRRLRFERLMEAVYEPVQRYLLRRTDPATADDVLADVLLVLWRRLDDVPAHNSLPWVYGVARGCLANNRRSAARQQRLLHRLALARPDEPSDDGELAEALAWLPSSDGEILRLWAWERLEPRDLARALGISANAASIRLHRAKKRLRKLLEARKDDGQTGQKAIRDGGGTAAR